MHKSSFIRLIGALLLASSFAFAERLPGRYIVELATEPVVDHVAAASMSDGGSKMRAASAAAGLRSAAAQSHRARVQAEQRSLRTEFENRNAKVIAAVNTVANAMVVEASESDAAQLASIPGVKRVVPVRLMHMVLDRAVILHKVDQVWNRIGSENAGAGMKIAIIDTGIDTTHPGMQDSSLKPPASFPRANADSDLQYTNNKVIVARSYVDMLPSRDPDESPRDHVGHGTALAMITAGATSVAPLATITGVAPKAYLGNYKVFGTPGYNDYASDDAILKAIDDAVADGMDVINLSLGDDLAPRLEDDLDVQAIERATKAGVIVVVAAGNNGPGLNTLASPGTAPSAITVGAITNDRTFGHSVEVVGSGTYGAIPGDSAASGSDVSATIADVAKLDEDGLACSTLPSSSLEGKIALILRGTCTFEVKLNNAQRAGAVAAIVYARAESPDAIAMSTGNATLPAEMVSYDDGNTIKSVVDGSDSTTATVHFQLGPVPAKGNRLASFSAAGPSVDSGIKPDVTAVGYNFYTATQTYDGTGDMYDPSGFVLVNGTSFSTPMVAGAAALIKAARPGLTVDQYRSLLIDTAADIQTQTGGSAVVQQGGGGSLDALAALNSTVTAYPASLSFGAAGSTIDASKTLTLTNLGTQTDTLTLTAVPRKDGVAPALGNNTIEVAPGASVDVPVTWHSSSLDSGAYEGAIRITSASSGTELRVPYWYAATGAPAFVTVLSSTQSGRRGRTLRDAVLFRVTDAAGVALTEVQPEVSSVSGGGSFRTVRSYDSQTPGLFGMDVRLSATPGQNVFRIQVGDAVTEVTISAQ